MEKNFFTRDADKRAALLEGRKVQLTLMKEASEKQHADNISAIRHQYKNVALEEANKRQMAVNNVLYVEQFYNKYLTEALKRVVSEALLVNKDQYKLLNEHYEEDVTRDITKLLANESIASGKVHFTEAMKVIVSSADSIVPTYEEYVRLFEEEEHQGEKKDGKEDYEQDKLAIFDKGLEKAEVKAAISQLAGEVKEKVAEIVAKEQEEAAKDIELIGKLNDMNQEKAAAEQISATAGVEGSAAEADMAMSAASEAIDKGEDLQRPEPVVQERYQHGIVEAFIINEAKNSIKENLSFNSDLALAKAVQFITITETFSAAGLMTITESTYEEIIKSSGLYKDVHDLGIASKAALRMENIGKKMDEEQKKYEEEHKPYASDSPRAEFGTPIKSYAEWKKEQQSAVEEKEEEKKPMVEMFTNGGKEYTRAQLTQLFENIGYNFEKDSFDTVCAQFNYKKIYR